MHLAVGVKYVNCSVATVADLGSEKPYLHSDVTFGSSDAKSGFHKCSFFSQITTGIFVNKLFKLFQKNYH